MQPIARALLAGALVGLCLGVLSLSGCASEADRRALSVADCVARMSLALPPDELPDSPAEVSAEDLLLALQVMDGVRSCRRQPEAPTPDGGP